MNYSIKKMKKKNIKILSKILENQKMQKTKTIKITKTIISLIMIVKIQN